MSVLAFGPDAIAVRTGDAIAIYDASGVLRRHVPVAGLGPTAGVYLPDGRLVLHDDRAAWILAPDGAITPFSPALSDVEVTPDGLLFGEWRGQVHFADPDTGEHDGFWVDGVVAIAPSGHRITTIGLAGPGNRPARPEGLDGRLEGACTGLPGDDRVWCQLDGCRIGAFGFDGKRVAEVEGCALTAGGPGGLVVTTNTETRWLGLDGAVRATFPRQAHDFTVGADRIGWTDKTGVHVRTVTGETLDLVLPPRATRPTGLVAYTNTEVATYGPDGALRGVEIGAAAPPTPPSRKSAKGAAGKTHFEGDTLVLTDAGGVERARLPAYVVVAQAGPLVLVSGPKAAALWDLDAGKPRWTRAVPDYAYLSKIHGDDVALMVGTDIDGERPGRVDTVYLDRAGKVILSGTAVKRSPDGTLFTRKDGGRTVLTGRDGRSYGTLPGPVIPIGVAGGLAIVARDANADRTVAGVDASGVRWERAIAAKDTDPLLYEGLVVVAADGVYALDPATGEVRWMDRALGKVRAVVVTGP